MRTNKQVEVFLYKKDKKGFLFLILKRTSKKGGFWQPITGGVEDEETLKQTIIREVEEETGIINILKIIDTKCSYEFELQGKNHIEHIYGVQIPVESEIILSDEHDELKWVNENTAFKLLKWPGNKEGLKILIKILKFKDNYLWKI